MTEIAPTHWRSFTLKRRFCGADPAIGDNTHQLRLMSLNGQLTWATTSKVIFVEEMKIQ